MAVRQERIIALINAAIEYRAALEMMRNWINSPELAYMNRDQLMAAIQQQSAIASEAVIQLNAQHGNAIFMEFTHFYRNQRTNTRKKTMMALKRRELGVEPRAQPLHHFDETGRLVIRHDILDQPKPLHIRPERSTRMAQTVEEALQLEQQIAELGAAEPEAILTEQEEADEADAPFRSPDGTPKPLFGNITNGILEQDEDEGE